MPAPRQLLPETQLAAASGQPWQRGHMSGQAQRLLDEALRLPEADRTELALRLLDSVGEPTEQVERAWIEEAKGRLAETKNGQVASVPWSEARDRIFAR